MANVIYKKLQVVNLTSDFEKAVTIKEAQLPTPKNGEVLLRNLYSGVNATDVNISAGRYFTDGKVPFDIGFESVGVVEAVGSDVSLKVGQPVVYEGNQGYAEYSLANVGQLAVIPEPKPEYLALWIVGLTAAIGLDEAGRIKKGEAVLITAAAGGTGSIAVQWAKAKGCHVIGMCSSAEKEEFLKSFGCDKVINYKTQNVDEVLSNDYPNGVDVIWETIGGPTRVTLFKHLAKKGRFVVLGSVTTYKTDGHSSLMIPNTSSELVHGSKQICGYLVLDYKDLFQDYFKSLLSMYESKKLRVRVDMGENVNGRPFKGLSDVANAYLHTGKSYGKVVVEL